MSGEDYYGANLPHGGPNGPGHYITGDEGGDAAANWHPSIMGGPPPASARQLEIGVAEGARGDTIEAINLELMGEQPGNVDDRAGQFSKLASALSTLSSDLRTQTDGLDANWESPSAKAAFLLRVGTTLVYLDQWQESASDTAGALRGLAGVMREKQEEMATLWEEYQTALENSKPDGTPYLAAKDGGTHTDINSKPTESETKEKYNEKARELAREAADAYLPYTQRIAGARGPKMTPLDGVFHPGAFGLPNLPGGPPGGAPGAPPGFGAAPPPGFGGAPTGATAAPPPVATFAMAAPPPTPSPALAGAPAPASVPVPEGTPPPGFTGAEAPPAGEVAPPPTGPDPAPLSAQGLTGPGLAGLTAMPPPGIGLTPPAARPGFFTPRPAAPPGFGTGSSGAPNLGVLRSPGLLNSPGFPGGTSLAGPPGSTIGAPPGTGLPPGTGMPPAGQQPGRQSRQSPQDGRSAPGDPGTPALPPGTPGTAPPGTRQSTSDEQDTTRHRQDAFLSPPGVAAPPVLGGQDRKRTRPGGLAEAPAAAGTAPGTAAAPPVLVNQRLASPRRSYTEQRAERRAAQRRRELDRRRTTPASEFATGLPGDVPSVLAGRTADAPEQPQHAVEVPAALRRSGAPAPAGQPAVQADRTDRRVTDEPRHQGPVTDESAWEVATPGGPVVAGADRPAPARPDTAPVLGKQ
ncbi:hypothetical protein BAY59_14755 [Prauserella coralliicola]|nr:hypothetical protein BAY59_14755 [Prauserella coralliicola]